MSEDPLHEEGKGKCRQRCIGTFYGVSVVPRNGTVETYALYDATVLQWLTLEAPTLHETWLRPWTEKSRPVPTTAAQVFNLINTVIISLFLDGAAHQKVSLKLGAEVDQLQK